VRPWEEVAAEAERCTRRYSIGIKLARSVGHAAWLKQKDYLEQLTVGLVISCLNSVSGRPVALISSKSRVYSLKDCNPAGPSASRSVGFTKWIVLIGRTGFDTMPSIPDPTLSFRRPSARLPTLVHNLFNAIL
jgi:hypothetical protein